MKVIDPSMLNQVYGGQGNNGGDRVDNGGGRNRGGSRGGGAPNTCANQVGANAIVGAALGIPGGPWGVLGGAVGFGLSTAVTCANNGGNNNSGALGGNSNANSVNGQCRW
jgi:hypothetical protein